MIYLLFAFLLIGVLINALSKKYALTGLYYKRILSAQFVEPDEEFEIITVIENNKYMPVTFLRIEELFPVRLTYKTKANIKYDNGGTRHALSLVMGPKQRVRRTYAVSATSRGSYILSRVSLTAGDFLGFSTLKTEEDFPQELVVYPRTVNLPMELEAYGSFYGDLSVRRWIIQDPVLTVGIREYTGAEAQKNIHWPSSLRHGRLMVKNFDFTTDNSVMIVLNGECGKQFWQHIDKAAIEKCISIARTITEELTSLKIPYSMKTNLQSNRISRNSFGIPSGTGENHHTLVLQLLGSANYGISGEFEMVLEQMAASREQCMTCIYIMPVLLPEYIGGINLLAGRNNKTVFIGLKRDNLSGLDSCIEVLTGREIS